jgi:SPOR domain
MADRYLNKSFPAGRGYDRDAGSGAPGNAESDPLAELARLIGQTDPFGSKSVSRANFPAQPQARPGGAPRAQESHQESYDENYQDGYGDDYYEDSEPEQLPPPAPPSWMQRAAIRQEAPPSPQPQDRYSSAMHPLHRYAAAHPPGEADHDPQQEFADSGYQPDSSRYDDALYGRFDSDPQPAQYDQPYANDAYGYEEDQPFEEQLEPRRRGGLITVAAVLSLAVFGVGGAFAYRSYTGGTRNGEPPIIRADVGPTKIMPAPAEVSTKVPDRLTSGDGNERIVSREETPIDPGTRSAGPRAVFPPFNPNGIAPSPPAAMSGAPPTTSAAAGTFVNNEPRAVRTLAIRGGDQATTAGVPAAVPAPAAAPAKPSRAVAANARASVSNPNTASVNAPLSLASQAEASAVPEPVRVASTNPAPAVPATPSAAASGNYLVSVTSQPSEAEAQSSYRALQDKYPSVLGSQSPVVARANSKSGAVTYRAGPSFGNPAEAAQFCRNYQAAGGQCWVVKN